MDGGNEGELRKAAIREEIRQKLGTLAGIILLGPVVRDQDREAECIVRVADKKGSKLPERLAINLSGIETQVSLKLEEGPQLRFDEEQCPGESPGQEEPPNSGADKDIRGSDAIYPNGKKDQFGTIFVAAKHLKIRSMTGNSVVVDDAILTAGHVFGKTPQIDDLFVVPGQTDPLKYKGRLTLDPTNVNPNVDAGLAQVKDAENYATGRIRGYGKFKTSDIASPTLNGWLVCVGSKSGITVGFDRGAFDYQDPKTNCIFKGLRWTSSGVGCCHDSGAPVLNQNGALIGMIVAGDLMECRLRPRSLYVPLRQWGVAATPTLVHDLELKIDNT